MNITKAEMLHFVKQMEDIAMLAFEGKVARKDLEDQFQIIRENIERWEDDADNI